MTLYILSYNNYYNRIIKKESNLEDYMPSVIYEINGVNFNPNDNIYTEQILGSGDYEGQGDYLLVVNEYSEIQSRWFILEAKRTRAGQYILQLYRDTIVDFYNKVITAPMFIEKADLLPDNPLVFNKEDMTFNQIKKKETLIKDSTNCAWIVGYYAKNTSAENLQGTIPVDPLNDTYDILLDTAFDAWEYNATEKPINVDINSLEYRIYAKNLSPHPGLSIGLNGYAKFDEEGNYLGYDSTISSNYALDFNKQLDLIVGSLETNIKAVANTLSTQILNYIPDILTTEKRTIFLNLNGKIIKDINGKYYQVSIFQEPISYDVADISAGSAFNTLKNVTSSISNISGTPNSGSYKVNYSLNSYSMIAVELSNLETVWDMTGSKLITNDSPYNIFAIPYGECNLNENITLIAKSKAEYALKIANSIIKQMDNNLYDIQLLPYCPLIDTIINGVNVKTSLAYSKVVDADGNAVSFILNIPSCKFTKNIRYAIQRPLTAINKKISNECDKYRLCSPNFNGFFDFSVAKNDGLSGFDIDCTLKPYQPYIHINPNFKGLYGQDFDDPRGLICGGDFSLTQIRDEWEAYQTQNKNFQEIFARQIEHMEVNNKYQKIQDILNASVGTISGGVSGAAAGLLASGGNPYAAIAGATVGTISSGVAGIADVAINEKLRTEAIDYTKDNFGYNLGNIQALPYSLTKVSALNNNNKIFPVLEYYTCTDAEKDAFKYKLAYNGMTTMCIGTMSEFLDNQWETTLSNGEKLKSKGYIKGKLIRLDGTNEDFHLINAISGELNKGVYIE